MDGAGILYENKDPAHVAALVDAVVSNRAIRAAVVAAQDAALSRLLAKDFAGTLLSHVEKVLSSPPLSHDVASDFWRQFETAERLEELRQYRPAIYKALPEEGAGR
jgi:hypothetical protein